MGRQVTLHPWKHWTADSGAHYVCPYLIKRTEIDQVVNEIQLVPCMDPYFMRGPLVSVLCAGQAAQLVGVDWCLERPPACPAVIAALRHLVS